MAILDAGMMQAILRRDWPITNFIDVVYTLGSPRVIWRSSETCFTTAAVKRTIGGQAGVSSLDRSAS